MSIIICGDMAPTESNQRLFSQGDAQALIGEELCRELAGADYRVVNLETPLCNESSPIVKNGPNLSASEDCAAALEKMGFDLVSMANNHILDQGETGLHTTEETVRRHGMACIGTGESIDKVVKSKAVVVRQTRVGFYSCAEHEFSVAADCSAGANPYDPLKAYDDVERLKGESDYCVVLYHGGKECYRYPSPQLQKICRKFVEKGADLVVCQHSHCIGCKEEYAGGTIVYGQGNFLFCRNANEYWNTGLVLALDDEMQLRYIPLVRTPVGVKKADPVQAKEILDGFDRRSEEILADGFVEDNYRTFALSMLHGYLVGVSGCMDNPVWKILDRLSGRRFGKWRVNRKFTPKRRAALVNYLDCEAHRELLLQGLRETLK
jgi:hypothetical protein